MNYRVVHITSEENVVADMLSRWGSGERSEEEVSAATRVRMRKLKARYGVQRPVRVLVGRRGALRGSLVLHAGGEPMLFSDGLAGAC